MSSPSDDNRGQTEGEPLVPCPRCPVRLRRHEMVKHLWLQHRLLLDGQRAREPWAIIGDWAQTYRDTGDRQFLVRSLELARRLDAEQGLDHLRELLSAREPDPFAEARRTESSLCPHCFALLPLREVATVEALTVAHGSLSWRGYRVQVSEQRLEPSLTVELPQRVVFQGPEGALRWTRRGTLLLFVWPPALLALVLALLLSALDMTPAPALLFLGIAGLSYLYLHVRGLLTEEVADRVLDHAWGRLVPVLHAASFSVDDSAFVAGLALASLGRGSGLYREQPLAEVLDRTEKAVQAGTAPPAHLSALWRLAVTDASAAGMDPVTLVARHLSRCLEGALPLTLAEHLLGQWKANWWGRGNLARLRVLVCERAFEAGFDVGSLIQAGRLAPALGDVLGIDRPGELARLRFLWSIRAGRPWARCGEAATVFELAAHAGQGTRFLEQHPDLLLLPGDVGQKQAIRLCAHGVAFGDASFTNLPRAIEVKTLKPSGEARYQLLVDDREFWLDADPDAAARRLERWCHYLFKDFAPQADMQSLVPRSPAGTRLRGREARPCPACGQSFVPWRGNLGLLV